MPYDFQWGVDDAESGNSYSHVENSDGKTTQGEYRVLLPDGRTQVVKFFDNGGGFNAEVTYE
ncbi:Cuticle Protein CPR RR Uncl [Hyalella azteca]|nr:Cuticle Protein CPR RR Uncl [Hyalella azteca]